MATVRYFICYKKKSKFKLCKANIKQKLKERTRIPLINIMINKTHLILLL